MVLSRSISTNIGITSSANISVSSYISIVAVPLALIEEVVTVLAVETLGTAWTVQIVETAERLEPVETVA